MGPKGEAGNPGLPGFSGPKGPAVSGRFFLFLIKMSAAEYPTCAASPKYEQLEVMS